MTGLQLAAFVGLLVSGGVVGLAWWAMPGVPRLGAALDALAGSAPATATRDTDFQDRLGSWSRRVLPAGLVRMPVADLAVLHQSSSSFYGEKLLLAGIGLVFPLMFTGLTTLLGFGLPWEVPAITSIVAAAGLFVVPNVTVTQKAKQARQQFTYALTSFIDLVALERRAGSAARQALQNAARVGEGSWVFARLSAALAESETDGRRPWEAFHATASDLGLPALDDLANIMALAEEQSMPVYQTLLEHNRSLRTALLTSEQARANAVNERLTIPTTVLVGVFVLIVLGPQLITMFTG